MRQKVSEYSQMHQTPACALVGVTCACTPARDGLVALTLVSPRLRRRNPCSSACNCLMRSRLAWSRFGSMKSRLIPMPNVMAMVRPCSSLMLSLLSRRRPPGADLGVRLCRWLDLWDEEDVTWWWFAVGVTGGGKSEFVVNMLWVRVVGEVGDVARTCVGETGEESGRTASCWVEG